MEPFTASGLKARPKNTIKDFVHVAGLLKVSHFCVFSKTNLGPYLKIARFPRGPTMSFRVTDYTLAREVVSLPFSNSYNLTQNHMFVVEM